MSFATTNEMHIANHMHLISNQENERNLIILTFYFALLHNMHAFIIAYIDDEHMK